MPHRSSTFTALFVIVTLFTVPAVGSSPATCYDNDGDGFGTFGDPSCPAGTAPDCNDGNAAVYPGAPEVCDGTNNDCEHPYWPAVAYWHEQVIPSTAGGAQSVFAVDLDGDGDRDALAAHYAANQFAWYENLDRVGSEWTAHVIAVVPELGTSPLGPRSVFAADVDGDGAVDALSASELDDRIVWWENVDGAGSTWGWHAISTTADGARFVVAADVDDDGDVDVLSASYDDSKIAWYENLPGDGSVWQEHVITTTADGAISVHVADVDGDDDLDALSASYLDGVLAWYENTAGDGSAWTKHEIGTASGARSAFAADLDGDGDQDALLGSYLADEVAWYENSSGDGSSWIEHVITTSANGATSVFAADMDADDDTDVLAASAINSRIASYGNFFGDGSAWLEEEISWTAAGAESVMAANVDGDDDMDVLAASSGKIAWYTWLSVEADDDDDGLLECDGDCDDTNPRCLGDCTDADDDGYCVETDCDDSAYHCTADCSADADGDGVICPDDCHDANPYCTTDCTDDDADGFCVTTDCADWEPQCTLDCSADADGDGVTCLDDCNDLYECVGVDCEVLIPGCGPHCPEGIPAYALPDADEDSTADCEDNCPLTPNDQTDTDWNGVGDPCDCGLMITTEEDGDDGECEIDCTLREALSLATTGCGIRVPAGTYSLELGYLPLEGSTSTDTLQLSLFGAGAGYTVLEGDGADPTLGISTPIGPVDLYVGGLSITHGGSGDGVTIVDAVNRKCDLWLNHVEISGIDHGRSVAMGEPSAVNARVDYRLRRSEVWGNSVGIHVGPSSYATHCSLWSTAVHHNAVGIRVDGATSGAPDAGSVGLDRGCLVYGNEIGVQVGGGLRFDPEGARATILESIISGNSSGIVVDGGTVGSAWGGEVTIHDCEIRDNTENGVTLESGCSDGCTGGQMTVWDSEVRDNGGVGFSIGGSPGGEAALRIEYSEISGNSGGGFYNGGQLDGTNCTISSNSTEGFGGGIYNTETAEAELNNVTIAANHAATGGGIYDAGGAGGVQISNSVIGDNTAVEGADCAGVLTSNGYNLVEDLTDCTIVGETSNIVGVDPMLGPLRYNGGWNRTHLPYWESPLFEAGNPADPGYDGHVCHPREQREGSRPQFTWCDIGSVELRPGDCNDVDEDGLCDEDDNCPGAPNPDQGPAALGQTIYAASAEEFTWEYAVDVVLMRGDLGHVDQYAVSWTDTVEECDSLAAADEPDPGTGHYYLVRPDCSQGSWQTAPGAEPDRDVMLP